MVHNQSMLKEGKDQLTDGSSFTTSGCDFEIGTQFSTILWSYSLFRGCIPEVQIASWIRYISLKHLELWELQLLQHHGQKPSLRLQDSSGMNKLKINGSEQWLREPRRTLMKDYFFIFFLHVRDNCHDSQVGFLRTPSASHWPFVTISAGKYLQF